MRYAAAALALLAMAPADAHAEEAVRRGPYVVSEWYGWQTLATDAAAVTSLMLAANQRGDDGEAFAWNALLLYSLGGPTVHWAHGNVGRGFGSLALRVGLPVTFAYGMCATEEYGCIDAFLLGTLVGVTSAIALDASALAYDQVTVVPRYGLRVHPTANVSKSVATFGLGGSF